jgi:hypothetical protein
MVVGTPSSSGGGSGHVTKLSMQKQNGEEYLEEEK